MRCHSLDHASDLPCRLLVTLGNGKVMEYVWLPRVLCANIQRTIVQCDRTVSVVIL
jgi:hypothetical protein